jgi:hypothetical protein
MSGHVHFNLDDFRTAHAQTTAQMRDQLAAGTYSAETRSYHELSLKLLDHLLELTIECFDARNNGLSELVIANALGTALGNQAGAYLQQTTDQGMFKPAMVMQAKMMQAIEMQVSGGSYGAISGGSIVHPMPGGHA